MTRADAGTAESTRTKDSASAPTPAELASRLAPTSASTSTSTSAQQPTATDTPKPTKQSPTPKPPASGAHAASTTTPAPNAPTTSTNAPLASTKTPPATGRAADTDASEPTEQPTAAKASHPAAQTPKAKASESTGQASSADAPPRAEKAPARDASATADQSSPSTGETSSPAAQTATPEPTSPQKATKPADAYSINEDDPIESVAGIPTGPAAPAKAGPKAASPKTPETAAPKVPASVPTNAPETASTKAPATSVPAKPAASVTPATSAALDTPSETSAPWAQLLANPSHTPELLAITAVQILGPRAQTWAERTREAYPTATPEALARLAVRQFTRFGTLTSLFGALAGSYAPIALVGTAALTDAELALHLAAAYGMDPTDPRRAADLLVIIGVHDSVEEAEAALAAAGRPAYESAESGERRNVVRLARLIAAQTAPWAVARVLNRRFPGTTLLAAVLSGRVTADATAVRATAYFKRQIQLSQSSGRS